MELFKLVGRLAIEGADEANKEIDGVTKKASAFKTAMGAIGKGALAVTGAVTAGTVALVKSVSGAYGELQQSIGGIETLFGDSADKVIENANNAFKTAGLSANDYMQQVTSFSASLLQAVGGDTEEACKTADMAIIDMADNANKMGTSMEMIQNAYQGFAKQNYTMLDNLKLGYGGTKAEMERLLADAEKVTGIKYDMSNLNDVYNAIHVIQTELGITGTTALEAGETIQGSFGSLSASWKNFMAGLGNPKADMEKLVNDVANALAGSINNVTPIIENITQVLPTVLDAIIVAIMDLLPTLIDTFIELVLKIVGALVNNLPLFLDGCLQLILGIANGLVKFLPELIKQLPMIVAQVIKFFISSTPQFIEMVGMIIVAIATTIPSLIVSIIDAFQLAFSNIITVGSTIMQNLYNTVIKWFTNLITNAKQAGFDFVAGFVEFVVLLPQRVFELCELIIQTIINWRNMMIAKAIEVAVEFSKNLINGVKNLPSELMGIGRNLVSGLWEGVQSRLSWLKNKISDWCDNIVNGFLDAFDINSPSRVTSDIGKFVAEGLGVGIIEDDSAERAMSEKTKSILDIAKGSLSDISFGSNINDLQISSPLQQYKVDLNAQIGELNDGFDRLIALIGQYLPNIASGMERNIVLDGNALVVGMSKRMDNQFGKMAVAKGRGNV